MNCIQIVYLPFLTDGPDPNTDLTANKSFSLENGNPELVCEMSNSNPAPEYSWYSGNTRIANGATFTITSEYYVSQLFNSLRCVLFPTSQKASWWVYLCDINWKWFGLRIGG